MKYLLFIMMMAMSTALGAQTLAYIKQSEGQTYTAQQVSLKNPWVGAKLSIPLQDVNGNLGNNTIFSARILYTLAEGSDFAIPVVTTVGLGSDVIISPESGINLGVFPYKVVKEGLTQLVVHGGAAYKLLPAEAATQEQFKILGGVEAILNSAEKLPSSLGLTAGYLSNPNTGYVEVTGIIPVGAGSGLFAEFTHRFNNVQTFNVGIIINSLL